MGSVSTFRFMDILVTDIVPTRNGLDVVEPWDRLLYVGKCTDFCCLTMILPTVLIVHHPTEKPVPG